MSRSAVVAAAVVLTALVGACSSDDGDDERIQRIDEPAEVEPDAEVSGG